MPVLAEQFVAGVAATVALGFPSTGATLPLGTAALTSTSTHRAAEHWTGLDKHGVEMFYVFEFHRDGTLLSRPPAAAPDRRTADAWVIDAHLATNSELLEEIMATFHLSKSSVARVVGVSRQSIHAWLRGEEVSEQNRLRLERLWLLSRRLQHAGVARIPLALECPVFPGAQSAADLIRLDGWNAERDSSLLVSEMLARAVRPPRAGSDRFPAIREVREIGQTLTRPE